VVIDIIIPHRKFHQSLGSHIECQYDLQTFGIGSQILAVDSDGILDKTKFLEKVETKKRTERERRSQFPDNHVECPNEHDVLLGRGRPYQIYPGNLQWAQLVDEKKELYAQAAVGAKMVISDDVLNAIRRKGGRFLKRVTSGSGWREVEDDLARDKSSQRFRVNQRKLASRTKEIPM